MFTVEEIKKIFELKILSDEWVLYPELDGGIHYLPKEEEGSVYAIYIKDGVMTRGIATYRLFLQEIIEGINRTKSLVCINQYGAQIGCYVDDNEYYITHSKKNEDRAKEKAIKYVLEKMEGRIWHMDTTNM